MERFFNNIAYEPNTGCWLWTGHTNNYGYGLFCDKKYQTAHRYSFKIHKGPIPPKVCVCHKCDVRSCVNPEHLFPGTKKDNSDDAKQKGRVLVGQSNPSSKLKNAQVLEIKQMLKSGHRQSDIARQFEVKFTTISSIKSGRSWAWLK